MIRIEAYGIRPGVVETEKLQQAFDDASRLGGLTVVVPRGVYLTGTLNMGSASLHLEKGAVLRASPDLADYRPNGYHHNEMGDTVSLLYAMDGQDVSITGEGVIDLNAAAFFDMDGACVPEDGHEYDAARRSECTRPYVRRPNQPIFFLRCRRIRVQGVRIVNAPCWTMSFHDCEDVRVQDITVDNDLRIPNNDGMHFCSCRNVLVSGCRIHSADDCIALSGITSWHKPCENVTIASCILQSASKALSIGYMHSTVRNVTISNCVIEASNRGVAIMSCLGTGLVEHVLFQNLTISTHVYAGYWWGNGEPVCIMGTFHHNEGYRDPCPPMDRPVNVRDIHFSHITMQGENICGVIGSGGNVRDVFFEDVTFTRLPSRNRCLKGERVIDVSPSRPQAEYPADFGGFIWVDGAENVAIRNVRELT